MDTKFHFSIFAIDENLRLHKYAWVGENKGKSHGIFIDAISCND
jgi:hypothetical protein